VVAVVVVAVVVVAVVVVAVVVVAWKVLLILVLVVLFEVAAVRGLGWVIGVDAGDDVDVDVGVGVEAAALYPTGRVSGFVALLDCNAFVGGLGATRSMRGTEDVAVDVFCDGNDCFVCVCVIF
jgi:hypothetical protein